MDACPLPPSQPTAPGRDHPAHSRVGPKRSAVTETADHAEHEHSTDVDVDVDVDVDSSERQIVCRTTDQLLTVANEHTTDIDDGRACRVAALMTQELAHPESINTRRDLPRRVVAAKFPHRLDREALCSDLALLDKLRTAITHSARPDDGWATLKKIVDTLHRADSEWMPEQWGYDTDLGLINATGEFDIRKVDRDGRKVTEIRSRHTTPVPGGPTG